MKPPSVAVTIAGKTRLGMFHSELVNEIPA